MHKAPERLRFAAVAVDVVVFGIKDGKLCVYLGLVNRPPHYSNVEAFIGGLIEVGETAEDALKRHLTHKTNLPALYTEQLYTFSAIERDKRNRVISVSYFGLVRPEACDRETPVGVRWCPVNKLPKLAYDHKEIFAVALERLRAKLAYTTMVQCLLPKTFTLTQMQEVYELVLERTLDKRNFRKKILSLDIIAETGEVQAGVKNRPAALYRFTSEKIKELSPIV